MKEIDFLPPSYREKNAVKHARLCQIGLALMFACMVVLAAIYQMMLHRSVTRDLEQIAAKHEDAIAKSAELARLREDVAHMREFAELYTFLRYPWPRTQMLAEIAKTLPPQVTLRELTIVEEAQAPRKTAAGPKLAVDIDQQPAAETPAQADLELLRRQRDRSRATIQLSGTTTDSGALHLFVMALNGTPLFASAKLHSMETIPGNNRGLSKFLIRLTARPGYGQPGGPQDSPALATRSNVPESRDRS